MADTDVIAAPIPPNILAIRDTAKNQSLFESSGIKLKQFYKYAQKFYMVFTLHKMIHDS